MFDIYTKKIYPVLNKDIHYRMIDCHFRFINKEVVDWIAEKGFDPLMGARPMNRVINQHIKKPLSRKMIFDKNAKEFTIKVKDNKINIE